MPITWRTLLVRSTAGSSVLPSFSVLTITALASEFSRM
jgi:hypothetical protein